MAYFEFVSYLDPTAIGCETTEFDELSNVRPISNSNVYNSGPVHMNPGQ